MAIGGRTKEVIVRGEGAGRHDSEVLAGQLWSAGCRVCSAQNGYNASSLLKLAEMPVVSLSTAFVSHHQCVIQRAYALTLSGRKRERDRQTGRSDYDAKEVVEPSQGQGGRKSKSSAKITASFYHLAHSASGSTQTHHLQ